MMEYAARIAAIRAVPPDEWVPAFIGEAVLTPKGPGTVVARAGLDDVLYYTRDAPRLLQKVRSVLGKYYQVKYASVTVEDDTTGDVSQYHVWDIEYDWSKDPEGTSWRSP
jgi:hypothetical protein